MYSNIKVHRSRTTIQRVLVLFLIGFAIVSSLKAQFPTIGEPMPPFAFTHVIDYPKTAVGSKQLLGKWYILDFWVMGCRPCIESFPAMSEMVKQFKGKVDIFSVAVGGKELEKYYGSIKQKKRLKIPMAFDVQLASTWQVNSFPHIFIVDEKGILRAITNETNADKLAALMQSGKNDFAKKDRYRQFLPNDNSRLYFINGNGGNDSTFLFRSVLAKATPDYESSGIPNINHEGPGYDNLVFVSATNLKQGMFQLANTSLLTLYNTAYFGQGHASYGDSIYTEAVLWPSYKNKIMWPILQVKDSSNFFVNYKTLQGVYTYSMSVPLDKANRNFVMRAMQLDLLKCFGYEAKVETRQWPVWKMVVTDPAKLDAFRTKGGDPETGTYTESVTRAINLRTGDILAMIANPNPGQIFIDETRLPYKIDIRMDGSLSQLDLVKKAFNVHGLDLVREMKSMKVLVISEPDAPIFK